MTWTYDITSRFHEPIAETARLTARGESPGRAAAVRGDDGKWGQTPFSRGVSTEEKMGSDPISLQRHFRHGLLGQGRAASKIVPGLLAASYGIAQNTCGRPILAMFVKSKNM